MSSNNAAVQPAFLNKLFRFVDAHRSQYISVLRKAVSMKSVSCQPDRWSEINKMIAWTAERFRKLGANTEMSATGSHNLSDNKGRPLQVPPLLLVTMGNTPGRKKLLVYLHVDVAPGWERGDQQEAYQLEEIDNGEVLKGRGVIDCKGPLICWLLALESYQKVGADIPVNLKFIIHGVHEIGSPGFEEFLRLRKHTFLRDVDLVCVTDSTWLQDEVPCMVYGTRGLVYFHVEVRGPKRNLHSGEFGGMIQEPLVDLLFLLNSLQDRNGNLNVPGLNSDILSFTPDEEEILEPVSIDVDKLRKSIGAKRLKHEENKVKLLTHRWRYPCLSYHGIQGACHGPEIQTIIPRQVVGKFSVRIVPNQTPEKTAVLVKRYLDALWGARNSSNEMSVEVTASIRPWVTNPWCEHYCAGRRAIKRVYRREPDLVRDGCSMDVVIQLQKMCNKSIILLPMCAASRGGAHAENESLPVKNFLDGIKLISSYIYEVAQIKGKSAVPPP